VLDIEKGTPELLDGSTVFAETVAGGKIKNPDADYGEDDQAGDPNIAGDVILAAAGDEEAADHGNDEGQGRCEKLRVEGFGIRVVHRHANDDRAEHEQGNEGMGEEPSGLAAEVADGFSLRDVLWSGHAFFLLEG